VSAPFPSRASRRALAVILAPSWSGCSLRTSEYDECTRTEECREAFGVGSRCDPEGTRSSPVVLSARELFVDAENRYAIGDYERAAELFEESYRRSRRPQVLLRLADAYERSGQLERAAAALQSFLEFERDEATVTRLEYMRARVHARARAQERPAARWLTPTLLGTSAAGLAAAGVFVVLGRDARSDADAGCNVAGDREVCTADGRRAVDRERHFSLLADVSFGVAAASFAVGGLLWLRDRDQPRLSIGATECGAMIHIEGALPSGL
jgi:tetratricopeptide (TPR) repeat protein